MENDIRKEHAKEVAKVTAVIKKLQRLRNGYLNKAMSNMISLNLYEAYMVDNAQAISIELKKLQELNDKVFV